MGSSNPNYIYSYKESSMRNYFIYVLRLMSF